MSPKNDLQGSRSAFVECVEARNGPEVPWLPGPHFLRDQHHPPSDKQASTCPSSSSFSRISPALSIRPGKALSQKAAIPSGRGAFKGFCLRITWYHPMDHLVYSGSSSFICSCTRFTQSTIVGLCLSYGPTTFKWHPKMREFPHLAL